MLSGEKIGERGGGSGGAERGGGRRGAEDQRIQDAVPKNAPL